VSNVWWEIFDRLCTSFMITLVKMTKIVVQVTKVITRRNLGL